MTVSVHIVSWNSKYFLPTLLESLRRQTLKPDRIVVIDNASTDGSIEYLTQQPDVHVLRYTHNTGFSHAHNQAIAMSKTDAVLVTNPDVLLEPRCLEQLVAALKRHDQAASVSPKLLRFTLTADDLREPIRSAIMDAAGMTLKRTRQSINRGEGQPEATEFPEETFGGPGVLSLYRRAALNDVAPDGEVFDEDFFAYKEDVDLAWRLRWAGWESRYIPSAIAYHHRTLTHHGDRLAHVFRVRRNRSARLNLLSYRNHLLMLAKNETAGTFFPNAFSILGYEIRRLGFLILREWGTLRAIPQAIRLFPAIIRKRKKLNQHRRISNQQMRQLFTV